MKVFCVTVIESDLLSGAIYQLQLIVVLRQRKLIWECLPEEAPISAGSGRVNDPYFP